MAVGVINGTSRFVRQRPPRDEAVSRASELDFRLFGHLEGVIHLDAKVTDGTLKFGMAEQ
jgi:hypothetical protein